MYKYRSRIELSYPIQDNQQYTIGNVIIDLYSPDVQDIID